MNSHFGLNWQSYLVIGAAAFVASSLFTGCTFGNNEIDQTVAWDGVTGYYDTLPTAVQLCATFTGSSAPVCAAGTGDQVPSGIASALTEPVSVKLQDSAGDTTFSNPASTTGEELTLTVNASTQVISTPSADTPNTYVAWPSVDANCMETDSESVSGSLTRYSGAAHTSQGYTITGRVGLTYMTTSSFGSGCTDSLTAMGSCYEDVANCGGTGSEAQEQNGINQQTLATLFTTLVNPAIDLGLLSLTTGTGAPANSIANLVTISLSVSYQ